MKKNTRLAGHGLRAEGSAWTGSQIRARNGSGPGMAKCECGEMSGMLPNRAARKRWHAEHKDSEHKDSKR
jgi:hypothetical protein